MAAERELVPGQQPGQFTAQLDGLVLGELGGLGLEQLALVVDRLRLTPLLGAPLLGVGAAPALGVAGQLVLALCSVLGAPAFHRASRRST